jgi:plasmid maintenance system antidote protein VapI
MERHETSITDLVDGSGVSRDVINKLKARADSSTTVENAVKIAAYYGKSVNQFLALREVTQEDRLATLFELLPSEAQRLLAAQVEGLLRHRDGQK